MMISNAHVIRVDGDILQLHMPSRIHRLPWCLDNCHVPFVAFLVLSLPVHRCRFEWSHRQFHRHHPECLVLRSDTLCSISGTLQRRRLRYHRYWTQWSNLTIIRKKVSLRRWTKIIKLLKCYRHWCRFFPGNSAEFAPFRRLPTVARTELENISILLSNRC